MIACCQTPGCTDSKPAGQGKVESDCGERIKLAVDEVRKQLTDRYSKVSVDAWGIKVSYDSGGGIWNAIFTLVVLAVIFGGVAFAAHAIAKRSGSEGVQASARSISFAAIVIGCVFLIGFVIVGYRLSGIHHELQNTQVELNVSKDANVASVAEVRFLSAQLASTQAELEAARAELQRRDTARTWLDIAGVSALSLIAIAVLLAATALQRSRASATAGVVEPSDAPLLKARRVSREQPMRPPEPKHLVARGTMWSQEVADAVSKLHSALKDEKVPNVSGWLNAVRNAALLVRQCVDDIIRYADERAEQ